ncbi:MAG: 4-hydroxy-tetrahydrodipicolinate reductase [Bdellovibrionales bacterium]
MKKLAVVGAAGRMGKEILLLLENHEELKVTDTVDPHGRTSARTIEEVDPERCDGVIDFSQPASTMKVAKWCAKHKKFLVSGTTGLSRAQQSSLKTLSRRIPILWAPNLSMGIAAMKEALKAFAGLKDFDFQIEEIHHRHKKDSPSGTAIALQQVLSEALGRRLPEPVSVRGGGVRGVHRVFAMGEGEIIYLEHVAMDRAIFARGAVAAAEWLSHQRRGFYGVDDLWQQQHRKR